MIYNQQYNFCLKFCIENKSKHTCKQFHIIHTYNVHPYLEWYWPSIYRKGFFFFFQDQKNKGATGSSIWFQVVVIV